MFNYHLFHKKVLIPRKENFVKYNIGLKKTSATSNTEPIFYGDLVYEFKRIVGRSNFSDKFKKIVNRYILGYHATFCPLTVYIYGFLFNCTTVGQASDSMTALT